MVNKTLKSNPMFTTIKKQKSAPIIRSTLRIVESKDEKVKRDINEKPSSCNVSKTIEELRNNCPLTPLTVKLVDKAQNTTCNDHEIIQELQEQNSIVSLKLEENKKKLESLLEQLDTKNKQNKEAENMAAIRIKELENNFKTVSNDKDALNLELDSSKKFITKLSREVDEISKTITAHDSELNTRIESLKEESKVKDSEFKQLYKATKKLNCDLSQALREKDEVAEETIILKNKLEELGQTYSILKRKFDKQKSDRFINILESSVNYDEIQEKNEKIRQLEEIISKHGDFKKNITRENSAKENTIMTLEDTIVDLKSELFSWETRAGCHINIIVRDNYVVKIENLEKENQQLKIKNKQLLNRCNKFKELKCERIEELEKTIKTREKMINEQDEFINQMRYITQIQGTNNGNEQIKNMIQEVFLNYDDKSRQVQQFEWNVRCLSARLPSLIYLLSAQKGLVATLFETWLIPSRYMNIPSFRIHRSDRPDGFGGVAVAIHHSLKSRLIPIDMTTRDNFYKHKIDAIGIEIVLDTQPPLEIWSCYIPSSSNVPFNICPILYNFNKADWTSFSLNIHDTLSQSSEDLALPNSYSNLTEIIINAAKSAIPVKSANHKFHPPTPRWWNSSCTEAVKTRSLHFKIFRRTDCLSDLLKYRNVSAHTTGLLKNEKRNNWKMFCSNLNLSCSIQYLWATAKRFKNCVNPTKRPENDDWFDNFCSKASPCHVPTESEIRPRRYPLLAHSHVLTNSFTLSELMFAISSWKSIAPGLDNISPVLLKHLPDIAVTGDYYKTFLAKKLRPEIRKKRPGMLQNGVSILHDNARPHIGAPVVALLEKYGWERLKHPPYSPDLSPPDFDLFPGIRFPNLDILNEEVSRRIRELNKDGVLCGIQALPKLWQSCIDKQGDYIEGL
ncbi:Endonuclease/exonuclease/phosphatase [Cinara cedri]|uniref:Endonuclease/exonuclease/phosphatase n=1 Tax=Cinara cedri TaxID=506608 RepID=A0A5E4N4H6_9HEMI|nr:Endonuclease/exonuclease/phosphatase [Cinara cedri]